MSGLTGFIARARGWRPRWSVFPTPRAAGALLGVGVLWLLPGAPGVVIAAGGVALVVAVLAWDALRLPAMRDLEMTRVAPETLGLGDTAELRYTAKSRWPWGVRFRLHDDLPVGLSATVPGDVLEIPPRGELTVMVAVTGMARGRQALGPVALSILAPLGLLVRIVRWRVDASVVVVPSLTNVRRFRLLALQHRLSDAGVRALRQRGEGGSFAGLREYVPGDDPRHVDWKATARHSRLISREQTIERSQTVISLIDCGRAMTQLAGRFSRLEHVLSASLLLSDVAATSGDRVGLIAFDDEIRAFVPAQRGTPALRNLRTVLSGLDATLTEPDYAAAFRLLATRQRRRALVVLFTDVIDARSARQFIAHAGRAARRHVVLVVAIENEALLAAARPTARGSLAVYRSAAAEELVHEREEALARMRQAGITVLDVAPTRMATGVVNRYLEIKARGML